MAKDKLPVWTEFHGLNIGEPATNIGDTEAVRCHNCDLADGIELLTDFTPSYGLPVTWQGNTFSIVDGDIVRNGILLGIPAPTVPVLSAAGLGGSVAAGDYEFLLTFEGGAEEGVGSESATVTAVANDVITVSWAGQTIPSRVDSVKIYARGGPNNQIEFCLVGDIDSTLTSQIFGTLELDPTQGIYDTPENGVPPSNVDYIYWHNSRLYAVVGSKVYYSNVGDQHFGFTSDQVWQLPSAVTGLAGTREDLSIAWEDGIVNIIGQLKEELMKRETPVKMGPTDFLTFRSLMGTVLYVNDDGIYEYNGAKETLVSAKIGNLFPLVGDLRSSWDGQYYCIDQGIGMDFENGDFFTFDTALQEFVYTTKEFLYDAVRKTGDMFVIDYSGSPTVRMTRDGNRIDLYSLPHQRRRASANRYFPKGRFERVQFTFSGGPGDKIHGWGFKRT